jgi:hypothetical protein
VTTCVDSSVAVFVSVLKGEAVTAAADPVYASCSTLDDESACKTVVVAFKVDVVYTTSVTKATGPALMEVL